jgi:hypothetical protein
MVETKTCASHPSSMAERARKQHLNSGANSGADSHTKLDKGTHFNPHAFGSHGETGTNKPTAGKVDVRNESRVGGKSKGSW